MDIILELAYGALHVLAHLFDEISHGDPEAMFWAAVVVGILFSVAWSEAHQ
jgi:hypothetical protein